MGSSRWRVVDRTIVFFFSLFALVSLVLEPTIALGVRLEEATDPIGRAWHAYASRIDPLLLDRDLSIRVMFGIDAFLFGPFYLVLVYAFARRREWIRMPAIVYASAMIYSLVVYYLMETLSPHAHATDFPRLVAIGACHAILPFVLLVRVWRAPLFDDDASEGARRERPRRAAPS